MAVTVSDADRRLAAVQPLTPVGFAAAFHAMQRGAEQMLFAAFSAGATVADAQAAAFAWAREKDLILGLISEINRLKMAPAFLEECKKAIPGLEFYDDLQALLNPDDPFIDPGELYAKLPLSCLQTCKVLIDGEAAGTGFLIAPNVVATAHHVVESLTRLADDGFVEIEDSAPRLRFAFGDFVSWSNGVAISCQPRIIQAATGWLIDASSCHTEERMRLDPPEPTKLEGYYDFALCRLSSILGIGFNGLPIEENVQLGRSSTKITILQHPKGRPMKYSRETALEVDEAVPPYRVPHVVNTLKGSSGAPCLNDDLRVVAIHQAGPLNGPNVPLIKDGRANRCIPISWMQKAINAAAEHDEPGLMPLAKLPDGHLVLGRSALSDWVYRNVRAMARDGGTASITSSGPLPILAVLPGDLPGKRFTGRLLKALLPEDRHRVVVLNTEELAGLDSLTALRLLWDICELPAETLLPPEGNTTMIAHLKHNLVKQYCDALAGDPDRRPTWIMLNAYDDCLFDGREGGTWDLLNLLFMAAGPSSRLFFVLTGYTSTHETPSVRQRIHTETLTPPTAEEIANVCRVLGRPDSDDKAIQVMIAVLIELCKFLPSHRLYPSLLKHLEHLGGLKHQESL